MITDGLWRKGGGEEKVLTCATGCMVILLTDMGNSGGGGALDKVSLIWDMSNLIFMERLFMKWGVSKFRKRNSNKESSL